MAELIGAGRCPVCSSAKARYTLSAKKLAVITCNACNFQGFARSDRSDELLRQNIKAAAAPVVPDPAPAALPADPAPADPAPVLLKPVRRIGWGLLAGREY